MRGARRRGVATRRGAARWALPPPPPAPCCWPSSRRQRSWAARCLHRWLRRDARGEEEGKRGGGWAWPEGWLRRPVHRDQQAALRCIVSIGKNVRHFFLHNAGRFAAEPGAMEREKAEEGARGKVPQRKQSKVLSMPLISPASSQIRSHGVYLGPMGLRRGRGRGGREEGERGRERRGE